MLQKVPKLKIMDLKSRRLAEMLATDENFSDEFYSLTDFDEKYVLVRKNISNYVRSGLT